MGTDPRHTQDAKIQAGVKLKVMDALGISEVLRSMGCRKIRSSGGNTKTNCPLSPWYHEGGSDKHPSLSVEENPQGSSKYRCFACGSKGFFIGLVRDFVRNGGFIDPQVLAKVEAEETPDLRQRGKICVDMFREGMVLREKNAVEVWSDEEIAQFAGRVPKYIIRRGISIETCKKWEIGYDEKDKRVIFPVRRRDGKLVGAVGRTILDNVEPKYITYFNFTKSNFFYGEHLLADKNEPTFFEAMGFDYPAQDGVIVVEGNTDVLKLSEIGYTNVAGVMTSSLSKAQIKTLLDLERPVYLMLDWDKAGIKGRQAAVHKLYERLPFVYDVPGVRGCVKCGFRWSKVVMLERGQERIYHHVCRKCGEDWTVDPQKKDPDQLTTDEIMSCLKAAKLITVKRY